MKANTWKNKIISAAKAAGTYEPCFDEPIKTLACILERRDEAEAQYMESGGKPIIEYTNARGATNGAKNPALVLWDELNKSALAYWRDLGLTPAGLKKINENLLKKKKKNALAEALKDIGG